MPTKNINTLLILLLLFLMSCKESDKKKSDPIEFEPEFGEKKYLNDSSSSVILPIFNSELKEGKNNLYAASFPFAWKALKEEINEPLSQFESKVLEQLNELKFSNNVLLSSEYQTSVERIENRIIARAYFYKALPFKKPLGRFEDMLQFKGKKINSFGGVGSQMPARVEYYHSDDDFAIKLYPKDEDHHIILLSNQKVKDQSFLSLFEEYQKKEDVFHKSAASEDTYLNDFDRLQIPIIGFNFEQQFKHLIGSKFYSKSSEFYISEAIEHTAFILDEEGAKVESESMVESKEEAVEALPKPKYLYLNEPFIVMLKRKDAQYPYFALYVDNTTILE